MLLKPPNLRNKSKSRLLSKRVWFFLCFCSLSFFIGYKSLQSWWVKPEAIFVLGGHEDRERLAAKLAHNHPNLPIWVSSGSPESYVSRIFKQEGIDPQRLHLNYQAKDTVTNFTTLADELKKQGIDSVYLITSDNHMKRARLVGEIVFGSRGIVIKPIAVPSTYPDEPVEKLFRDGARAILWILTGESGENLLDNLKSMNYKL
ncbi:MAG: YdcF family protein [Microcystaceae cyanobacterium]